MTENNESVTVLCNTRRGYTKREISLIEKATRINEKEQRPFSVLDFSELTPVHFRQIIHKLHEKIEVVYKSRPCYYKIKGIELVGDSHRITQRVMGEDTIYLLQKLRDQPPKIHDLKFKFQSDLHHILKEKGCSVNTHNHSIKLNIPSFDDNITAKLLIYPKTVQLDIGCTFKPFVYDIPGLTHLTWFLGRICGYIDAITNFKAEYPPSPKWIITHYHFGKDGTEVYTGQLFHRTYEEFSSGLVRFYSKTMPDGKVIPRIEQIVTPKISLDQEIERMIRNEKC